MKTKKLIFIILLFTNGFAYSQNSKSYEFTHGEEVTDYMAPYIKDFCDEENIICDSLIKLLLADSLRTEQFVSYGAFYLGSPKHSTGQWTYFTAKTALIYEMEKYDDEKYVVLYSRLHPELILKNKESEWRIAVIDKNFNIISDKKFLTYIKYDNTDIAMWDMIYTSLEINNQEITANIIYVHTGSGGGRDQGFTAKYSLSDIYDEIKVIQTIDEMD